MSNTLDTPADWLAFETAGGQQHIVNRHGYVCSAELDVGDRWHWNQPTPQGPAAVALYARLLAGQDAPPAEPLLEHDCDARATATFELQSLRRWVEAGCGGCASVDNILGEIDARTAAAAKGAGTRARIAPTEPEKVFGQLREVEAFRIAGFRVDEIPEGKDGLRWQAHSEGSKAIGIGNTPAEAVEDCRRALAEVDSTSEVLPLGEVEQRPHGVERIQFVDSANEKAVLYAHPRNLGIAIGLLTQRPVACDRLMVDSMIGHLQAWRAGGSLETTKGKSEGARP